MVSTYVLTVVSCKKKKACVLMTNDRTNVCLSEVIVHCALFKFTMTPAEDILTVMSYCLSCQSRTHLYIQYRTGRHTVRSSY